jgi:hypothetical protein
MPKDDYGLAGTRIAGSRRFAVHGRRTRGVAWWGRIRQWRWNAVDEKAFRFDLHLVCFYDERRTASNCNEMDTCVLPEQRRVRA